MSGISTKPIIPSAGIDTTAIEADIAALQADVAALGDSATKDVGTGSGTVAAGDDSRFGTWTGGSTNLNAATGRTSLGLGDSATKNTGTGAGTVAAGDDSRFGTWTGAATNLVAATGRTSLGLGGSATLNVGTGSGTVAAGDDSRFGTWTGAATNLNAATGRTSLGLGDSATKSTGTSAGTVAAGDDSRFPLVSGRITDSTAVNNSTALISMGCDISSVPAGTYLLDGVFRFTTNATADIKFQLSGTNMTGSFKMVGRDSGSLTPWSSGSAANTSGSTNEEDVVVQGIFTWSSTGTFAPTFAQNVATSVNTVIKSAAFRLTRIL